MAAREKSRPRDRRGRMLVGDAYICEWSSFGEMGVVVVGFRNPALAADGVAAEEGAGVVIDEAEADDDDVVVVVVVYA